MYRSYGTLKSCEREQSGTSTVGRCGTHGGPPGRMILAQYIPRSTFRFLTELMHCPRTVLTIVVLVPVPFTAPHRRLTARD